MSHPSETTIKEQEAPALLPCPLCGGAVELYWQEPRVAAVSCPTCGFDGPSASKKDRAVELWNRRADPWIPVAERLPAAMQTVLLLRAHSGGMMLDWHYGGVWHNSVANQMVPPTHWMPLPAAPKGGA